MSPGRTTNILLIEDDEVDVMNVRRALQKNHLTTSLFVASNGLEALAMLGQNEAHLAEVPVERRLILLDLNMPKMGGLEFLQALRTHPSLRGIPVVVLTTSNREEDLVGAYNLNVAGYLLKPLTSADFADLMVVVDRYWALCEMP